MRSRPGRGRKKLFNIEQQQQIKKWVKETPKNLSKVRDKIHKKWGINTSKNTIKRIIRNLEMTWKRMKRGLSKSPDEWELEVKLPKLASLKNQDKKGEIDLRYFDESGFSLIPSVPYAWRPMFLFLIRNPSIAIGYLRRDTILSKRVPY